VKSNGDPEPDFTLHLPDGWTMARSEESDAPQTHFVFEAPGANEAYLFCRVERCSGAVRDDKLKTASGAAHREFLSGGEADVDYFEPRHFVAWKRTTSKGEFVVVDATFFGRAIYHFKFFTPRKEFAAFEQSLRCVVDNIEVHGTPPQAAGNSPETRAPLTDEELKSLFEAAENPGSARYFWMAGLGIVILSLYFIERTIRLRRHRAAMEELDKQIEERKASKKIVDARNYFTDADSYTKKLSKR
jgi:hypothetical protein